MSMLEDLLTYLTENRSLFRLLFEKTPNTYILDKLYQAINKMVMHRIENNAKNGIVYVIPHEVISAYFTGAFISLLEWWVVSDNPYKKEQMKDYMRMLIQGSFESIIDGEGKNTL